MVSGDQVASDDRVASDDQVVSGDQVASDDRVASGDQVASGDRVASGNLVASDGQAVSDHQVASDDLVFSEAVSDDQEGSYHHGVIAGASIQMVVPYRVAILFDCEVVLLVAIVFLLVALAYQTHCFSWVVFLMESLLLVDSAQVVVN